MNESWVIFDLIGVLAEPSWRDLAPDRGGSWAEYKLGNKPEADFWEDKHQRAYRSALGFRREMLALVRRLKAKGVKVGLATNFSREWLDALLDKAGGHDLFDAVFVSSEMKTCKPEQSFFEIVKRSVPAGSLFIDDQVRNCEAAERVGFVPIWAHPALDVSEEVHAYFA